MNNKLLLTIYTVSLTKFTNKRFFYELTIDDRLASISWIINRASVHCLRVITVKLNMFDDI